MQNRIYHHDNRKEIVSDIKITKVADSLDLKKNKVTFSQIILNQNLLLFDTRKDDTYYGYESLFRSFPIKSSLAFLLYSLIFGTF